MASKKFQLEAVSRANVGKGASRRLRHDNAVPAIVYGGDKAPANIAIQHHHLQHALEHEAFFASIVTLKIDGKDESVVIKDLQRHPARPRLLHADFQRVDENKPVHMKIPLHFVNETTAAGVKVGGGIVTHLMTELEISCLPKHLPEYIEVDIQDLALGASLHISDLKLPEGVSSVALSHGESGDLAVVSIHAPRRGEETPAAGGDAAAAAPAAADKGKEKK
ncbi:MAG: 50S ribosomal protein L25/general stress protein Ctc [Pseudomonadota bacterium]|nr:50S ribosomal protein L25/general stress protein Ctc [Pseudomonadota bacterium]